MKRIIKTILGVLALLAGFGISNVLVYLLTNYIFDQFSISLSSLMDQVINAIVSIILFFSVLGIFGRTFHHPKQMKMIKEFLRAIKSISRGEFKVSVDLDKFKDAFGPDIGKIIDSFNKMAINLEQVENMRQEFISNVSHEIQSPLTSIKGFAKVLQNEDLPLEERVQYLKIIEHESTRLSKLSDNLLKLTSLESQNTPLEKNNYSLNNQLMYTILSCEPQILEKQINLKVDLNKVDILGDENLLNQVWMNLISNSIKFTPNNGEISISLNQDLEKIIIKVKDNGIGISIEDQFHIFERFYKADKSRDRNIGGNGLGLSIVKKIVEMHDGKVYVDSVVGKGSTFIVELPIQQ